MRETAGGLVDAWGAGWAARLAGPRVAAAHAAQASAASVFIDNGNPLDITART
jgi:hypothetical protein